MRSNVVNWVASKLVEMKIEILDRTADGILIVKGHAGFEFPVAVIGAKEAIQLSDVEPLFQGPTRPEFLVNVPTATLWTGAAIDFVHAAPAAFGTLSDVLRVAEIDNVPSYRNKNMGFFINAMKQHNNVKSVSYVFDRVFRADRNKGQSLIVAVVDAYNLSAEDVRHAKKCFGNFNVVVKSSSHGSITQQAYEAAQSMGVEAMHFGGLMRRLAK